MPLLRKKADSTDADVNDDDADINASRIQRYV